MAATSSTSSSKRALLHLLLPVALAILVGCWVLDTVVLHTLVIPARSAGAYKVQRMFEEEDPNEVPILGSSRAAGSYVPELIDARAFNYGIEKTEHALVEMMLSRELTKTRTTPIIINWDYEFFRSDVGNMAHFISNLKYPAVRAYAQDELHWYHRVPGMRFFGEYDAFLKAALGEHSKGNVRSAGGVFESTPVSPEKFRRLVKKRLETQAGWIDPVGTDSTLLRLLRSSHRPIVIVVAPYHASCFVHYTHFDRASDYLHMLDAIANVTVIDLGQMPLMDDHFVNTSHVNYLGAQAFSAALGREWKLLFPER
jgi:hypothetical protein